MTERLNNTDYTKPRGLRRKTATMAGIVGITGAALFSASGCDVGVSNQAATTGVSAVRANILKLNCTRILGYNEDGVYTDEGGTPQKIVFLGSTTNIPDVWGAEVEATFGTITESETGRVIDTDTTTIKTWVGQYYDGTIQGIRYGAGSGDFPENWSTELTHPYVADEYGAIFYQAPAQLRHTTVEAEWRMAPSNSREVNPDSLSRASVECYGNGYPVENQHIRNGTSVLTGEKVNFEPEPGQVPMLGGVALGANLNQ